MPLTHTVSLSSPFWCFEPRHDYQQCPKWGPGENRHVWPTREMFHNQFFENPFRCIVRKRQMGDILWPETRPCLVSDRTLSLFRSARLTGFDVRPADVRLLFPHDPHEAKFWQLIVTGWGGMARAESGIRRIPDPAGTGRLCYTGCTSPREIIDPDQWDRTDFFIVWPLPNYYWITDKVREILQSNELRHYRLLPPEEFKSEAIVGDEVVFGPGGLRYYFSDERARGIGEPLGIY